MNGTGASDTAASYVGFEDPEPLNNPQDMAVSPLDITHFYVASAAGNEILRYNLNGSFDKIFVKQGDHGDHRPDGHHVRQQRQPVRPLAGEFGPRQLGRGVRPERQ